jgi:hypothetical protein
MDLQPLTSGVAACTINADDGREVPAATDGTVTKTAAARS